MSAADAAGALTLPEVRSLFADLSGAPALVLGVSGGPDSTALMLLAARWCKALRRRPRLVAVTVDHGLRPEAAAEAAAVARLARALGVEHRTFRWRGRKPAAGIQQAARLARYRLLARAAREVGARHVLTAHTLDDQAETVLIRLTRGSGLAGLAAMGRVAPLPAAAGGEGSSGCLLLVRPLLEIPKARLLATLQAARISFADDPSNRDPRFARARFRAAMPLLEREGLGPDRLALLARRLRRADMALEAAVSAAAEEIAPGPWPRGGAVVFPAGPFGRLPEEISLRLLGRAVSLAGTEGPVELGKLEALHEALLAASPAERFRRTLAGAVVTASRDRILVEPAPPRRRGRALKRP